MIAVIQRVTKGKVVISGKTYSETGPGYVILLGVFEDDNEEDVVKLTDKIAHLRIMSDEAGKMNKSIIDTKGEILLVSQFTLCADAAGGRRPSFIKAKKPEEAKKLYQLMVKKLKDENIPVRTGEFAAYMNVQIFNDGPVTIILDSKKI
jgi:D-tyrosyl-tRNA(Tyr) deacylase